MTNARLAKLRAHISGGKAMYYGADELLAEVDRLRSGAFIDSAVALPNAGVHVEIPSAFGILDAVRDRSGHWWALVPIPMTDGNKAWGLLEVEPEQWRPIR